VLSVRDSAGANRHVSATVVGRCRSQAEAVVGRAAAVKISTVVVVILRLDLLADKLCGTL